MSRSKTYQRLLNSKEWRTLRADYLRAHPLCEMCLRKKPQKYVAAVDCHHIIPVESGKTLDEMKRLCFNGTSNLQALCIDCHIKVHQAQGSHTKEAHKQRESDRLQQWISKIRGGKPLDGSAQEKLSPPD